MSQRVILLTPYDGAVEFNLMYLRACMKDSIARGESPIAAHGLYTQPGVLPPNDLPGDVLVPWLAVADYVVVYADLNTDDAMERMLTFVHGAGKPEAWRKLGRPWTATNCWGVHISQCSESGWSRGVREDIERYSTAFWR